MKKTVSILVLAATAIGLAVFFLYRSSVGFVSRGEILIIGTEVRTTATAEIEGKGQIGEHWMKFYADKTLEQIPNRTKPDEMLAVYTDYAGEDFSEYSHILGVEVTSLDNVPAGMVGKKLPAATYAQFTSSEGPIPAIIFELWQKIWLLEPNDIGGKTRAYQADFEVYDKRSEDPAHAQIDVFLSVK